MYFQLDRSIELVLVLKKGVVLKFHVDWNDWVYRGNWRQYGTDLDLWSKK